LSSGERRRDSINRNKQIRRNHMSQRIKVCTDRILPKDLIRLQPTVRTREGGERAIALLARHG
jgi:translation initiation factor IF-1